MNRASIRLTSRIPYPEIWQFALLGVWIVWSTFPALASEPTAQRPAEWGQPVEAAGVPNLHRVSDALFRSGQPTAEGMKSLRDKQGIVTVVNLRSFHSDRDEIGATGLAYEHIYMKAWHPEEKEAVRFLQIVTDPKRTPVLVHCQRGADRTGAMCAVYRIAVEGWTKEEAVREMTAGGYGFHPVWVNLPAWIEKLDVESLRRQAGIEKPPQPPDSESTKAPEAKEHRVAPE
jgi:protein tyrosine phosphatase (PTP) superfamily phosphohydrolase (DUF442 family)